MLETVGSWFERDQFGMLNEMTAAHQKLEIIKKEEVVCRHKIFLLKNAIREH